MYKKGGDVRIKRYMNMLKKRILAGCIALACALGMVTALPEYTHRHVEATTLAELEAQREANNKKIQELESEMAGFQESQKEEAAYQKVLQDKIDTIQSNMQILDTELEDIKEEIFVLNADIDTLEATIAQQEIDIEEGLEEFKLRLRAMYVNGNDSLASALVGATDFYDLLSKYELISCIARHDDELVNNLKDELASYEVNLDTLNVQMTDLEAAEAEAEEKRQEMAASMEDLQAAYQESEAEQQRLAEEEALRNENINMLEEKNALLDEAEKEILEQIRREEEARKKAEEEARKKAEEEAKKKAEEEANKNNNNNNNNNSTPTPTPTPAPDYSGSSFSWPCPGYYYVSSRYGYRWGKLHKGIDIAQNRGATITASRSGKVIAAYTGCKHNYAKSSNCCGNGYGNYVLVSHGDGYTTMYAHMQSVYVSVGESVGKGQALGQVGCTGHSTGFHLHFEIRKNGTAVNPSSYLNY